MRWKKRMLIVLSANMGTSSGDSKFSVSGGKKDLEWCGSGVQGLNRFCLSAFDDSFQPWDSVSPCDCVASSKWAQKEKANGKAAPETHCSSPVDSALFGYLKSSFLNAWSLSLAARQANTGPGVRREGGGVTTKRPLARSEEEEPAEPASWLSLRGSEARDSCGAHHLRREGLFHPWLPGSHPLCTLSPAEFILGWSSLKGKRARCWGGARLQTASSSTFVIWKLGGKVWDGKLKGVLNPLWGWAAKELAFRRTRWWFKEWFLESWGFSTSAKATHPGVLGDVCC